LDFFKIKNRDIRSTTMAEQHDLPADNVEDQPQLVGDLQDFEVLPVTPRTDNAIEEALTLDLDSSSGFPFNFDNPFPSPELVQAEEADCDVDEDVNPVPRRRRRTSKLWNYGCGIPGAEVNPELVPIGDVLGNVPEAGAQQVTFLQYDGSSRST
jgi:hypothetical protein